MIQYPTEFESVHLLPFPVFGMILGQLVFVSLVMGHQLHKGHHSDSLGSIQGEQYLILGISHSLHLLYLAFQFQMSLELTDI